MGVVTGDPAAVKRAYVYLLTGPTDEEGRLAAVAPDGTYRFDDVVPGSHIVRVGGQGITWTPDFRSEHPLSWYSSSSISVVPGRTAAAPVQHVVMAEDVGHIDIVDPKSDQGAFSVWAADDPDRAVIVFGVATNGDVSQFPLAPGRYKIALGMNGWFGGRSFDSAKVYTVKPGETLAVKPPARLTQVIRGNVPLGGVRVLAYAADDPTEVVDQAASGREGQYYLYGFSPDHRYKLRAIDPSGRLESTWLGGKSFHSAKPVTSAYLQANETHGISMKRRDGVPPYVEPSVEPAPGQVRGSVSGPGLDPERYRVQLVDSLHEEMELYDTYFKDDRTYTFGRVRPGNYKIRLGGSEWAGGRSFASATVIHVEPDTTVTQDVELRPTGKMEANVRNQNGRPIPGLMIEVHTGTGPDEIVARETPNQYDYYAFWQLLVQPYKFRVIDAAGRYPDTWIGGGTSRATAPSFVPDLENPEATLLPDTYLRPLLRPMLAPGTGGTPVYGRSLTATSSGTWSMTGLTFRRQWLRDGSPIAGQTGSTYRLRSADVGRQVSLRITGSRTGQPTRVAESRPRTVKKPVARMKLRAATGRRSSLLRVRIAAPTGISQAKMKGTVKVRDHLGTGRMVKATMRRGKVTVPLRRIKNGLRDLEVRFEGPQWVTVPKSRILLKVR
ncbi:hypothetical protein [Aeromicrobium chenweiae]|uniref:hypothetical protein n=1 Tax=Aeromicrobium chenweiae TaxID=2079793 RepID=UPI0010924C0A|nr:hypothetical protein [Aeromicrobium chenweiae]TGN32960.1 hypothetical protein E4L97_09790 [Aeromicrobium chenweiae]